MAVRIELGTALRRCCAPKLGVAFACALAATSARAEVRDDDIVEAPRGWSIVDAQLRTSFVDQNGRGYQSQEGTAPGSEAMFVFQAVGLITVRQSERVLHQLALPIDAISAASPDAVDATSSASRNNVAGDFDLRSTFKLSEVGTLSTRFTAHAEEWLGGGTVGVGYRRALADDNASVSVNGSFGHDVFDQHDHFGSFLGKTGRSTANVNVAASQIVSPTTIADASYGLTYQSGALDTGWNAVPLVSGGLGDEKFPRGRLRHALAAGIAQHLPRTRTTAKLRYRFYADDFGLRAHTAKVMAYQYIVPWLYATASYRYHRQNGVDFFTIAFDPTRTLAHRTADSDLASFGAHELAIGATTVRGKGPLRKWWLTGELLYYDRSNNLRIVATSAGIGRYW